MPVREDITYSLEMALGAGYVRGVDSVVYYRIQTREVYRGNRQ